MRIKDLLMTDYFVTAGTEYSVILLMGHSMAKGWAPDPGPTPDAGTVFEWDKSSDTIVEVGANDLLDANFGSPWPAFGIELNARLGIKPLFVHVAQESAKVATAGDGNDFTASGDHWPVAVGKTNLAIAEAGGSLYAVAIILGHNDSTESKATILSAYTDFIDRINAEWDSPTILLFREPSYNASSNIHNVADVQSDLMELYDNVVVAADLMTVVNSDNLWDGTHPNYDGNMILGTCGARCVDYMQTRSKHAASACAVLPDEVSSARMDETADFVDWVVSQDYQNTHLEYMTFYQNETKLNCFQSPFRRSPRISILDPTADPTFIANDSLQTTDAGTKGIYTAFNLQRDKRFIANNDMIILIKLKDATNTGGLYLFGHYDAVEGKVLWIRRNAGNSEYAVNDLSFTVASSANLDGVVGCRRFGSTKGEYNGGVEIHTAAISVIGSNLYNTEFILGQFPDIPSSGMGFKAQYLAILKYDGLDVAEFISRANTRVNNW